MAKTRGRKRKQSVTLPGQERVIEEKIKPTPELEAKRKAGVRDELIDTLREWKLISEAQEQAFRRFERARSIHIGKVTPKLNQLAEFLPGSKGELSDERIKWAAKTYTHGDSALQIAGDRPRRAVTHLICHNEVADVLQLQIGLTMLVSAYGIE